LRRWRHPKGEAQRQTGSRLLFGAQRPRGKRRAAKGGASWGKSWRKPVGSTAAACRDAIKRKGAWERACQPKDETGAATRVINLTTAEPGSGSNANTGNQKKVSQHHLQ